MYTWSINVPLSCVGFVTNWYNPFDLNNEQHVVFSERDTSSLMSPTMQSSVPSNNLMMSFISFANEHIDVEGDQYTHMRTISSGAHILSETNSHVVSIQIS